MSSRHIQKRDHQIWIYPTVKSKSLVCLWSWGTNADHVCEMGLLELILSHSLVLGKSQESEVIYTRTAVVKNSCSILVIQKTTQIKTLCPTASVSWVREVEGGAWSAKPSGSALPFWLWQTWGSSGLSPSFTAPNLLYYFVLIVGVLWTS